ncbi:MAG: APC family permease [Candidatus Bathyarchaeia archaeon]
MTKCEQPKKLKPTLGLWDATALSVGAIIGGGIFVVTGIVAGLAGSALVVSMVLAAVIALFTALSFAELSAWKPVEGSVYVYARELVSPFAGFLTGWMWLVSNTFGGAAVSLGFAYYLAAAFPGLPVNVVAAVVCLAFTGLNFVGVRQSALLNNVLVAVKLAILGAFVVFGSLFVDSGNFVPFVPLGGGVLFGTYFIFFAYGGFARAAVVAEEVKDAKRTVPRAVLLSLGISMVVYLLVGLVAVGLVGSGVLAVSSSPLATAIAVSGSSWAVDLISFGGLVATASVLLTAVLGVSRMAFSMARNRDLPFSMCRVHERFGTPFVSIWIAGAVMALLVLLVDLTGVVAVSTFALLFGYVLANVAAFRLRCEPRCYPRFVPGLGLATCLLLLGAVLFVAPYAWVTGVAFLVAGMGLYIVKKKFWALRGGAEVCGK